MKFDYKKDQAEPIDPFPLRRHVKRPVLPVELTDKDGRSFRYACLVDSGSDYCIFHKEIADAMGIGDITRGYRLEFCGTGDTKQVAFVFHEVPIKVGGHELKVSIGFIENFKVPYGLLGQVGLFDQSDKIVFQYKKERFEINLV